jgi:hypothetical protein
MRVRVFLVKLDGTEPTELPIMEAKDKAAAKAMLAAKYEVRSVNYAKEGGLVAYVEDGKRSAPPPRKKPVSHDGIVGRGRVIRRRR